jgi:hypothetical protein
MSQNNDLLLEALAEKQAEMEKEIKKVKKRLDQTTCFNETDRKNLLLFNKCQVNISNRIEEIKKQIETPKRDEEVMSKNIKEGSKLQWLIDKREYIFIVLLIVSILLNIHWIGKADQYENEYYIYHLERMADLTSIEADSVFIVHEDFVKETVDSIRVSELIRKVIEEKIKELESEMEAGS